jgi:hypothetical protein
MKVTRVTFRLLAALTCLTSACSARAPGERPPPVRVDYTLLTEEQLREHHFNSAYEAVAALRSRWLETRGTDSFNRPSQVLVYLDDTRLGGVETLRQIALSGVLYIRYIDGITASGRWGLDHGQGVIQVSTRRL